MRSSAIAGCCGGRNIYNLGGAHGWPRARDQDEFDEKLVKRQPLSINIAITSPEQDREREYLGHAGFEHKKVGDLWISTISYNDLVRYQARARGRLRDMKPKVYEEAPAIFSRG